MMGCFWNWKFMSTPARGGGGRGGGVKIPGAQTG